MNTLLLNRFGRLTFSLLLGLLWVGCMVFVLAGPVGLALAANCTVTPGSTPYPTIQAAINDLNCDPINIPAGTQAENLTIARSLTLQGAGKIDTVINGSNASRVITITGAGVVAHINDLRITGGNATSAPAPDTGFGGGILVTGDATLHGQNLQIDNNVANNLGGAARGGGLAVRVGAAYLTNTMIFSNAAKPAGTNLGQGGGLYAAGSAGAGRAILRLTNSQVLSNVALKSGGDADGGGLYVGQSADSQIYLSGNTWQGNIARSSAAGSGNGMGGALSIELGPSGGRVAISNDHFMRNIANEADLAGTDQAKGGGVFVSNTSNSAGVITLTNVTLAQNIAKSGGGAAGTITKQGGAIYAEEATVIIERSTITRNVADVTPAGGGDGGGIAVLANGLLTSTNNFLLDNAAAVSLVSGRGAGIYISGVGGKATVFHTTLANVIPGQPHGIFGGGGGQAMITNTIIASYTQFGIACVGCGTMVERYNLFYGVPAATSGAPILGSDRIDSTIHPFINPASGDYHLNANSDAIDTGINAGVLTDFDGDSRPQGSNFDRGADEAAARLAISKTGPISVTSGSLITYTLRVTNTGSYTAVNPVITDTLPVGANYVSGGVLIGGNVVSLTIPHLPPNGLAQATFSVTATQSITNSDYRVRADGNISATGNVAVSTQIIIIDDFETIYLPIILKSP